ncbi:MAG TPA: hypothetical protein VGE39_15580 [Prosthecobacter sp.]
MLAWNKTDLLEFFEVDPDFNEAALSHSFEVNRDGLRLLVTLFAFENAAYVSLYREGQDTALFTVRREECTHVHVTVGVGSRLCFEVGKPQRPVTDMGMPPVLVHGFRVYVWPSFQVELIEKC